MSASSRIEWTDATWNPVTGCTPISAGCSNCYARRMATRFGGPNGFAVMMHLDRMNMPKRWRKPRRVFVNSMGDLFHGNVALSFIADVFGVMNDCPQHTFQILTKRPERMAEVSDRFKWTPNIWAGVTVENQNAASRIGFLLRVPARVRFLSCEPLLEPVLFPSLAGIGWIIVGGETGPNARSMADPWPQLILEQAKTHNIPFFFKRWGGRGPHRNEDRIDGVEWKEWPA